MTWHSLQADEKSRLIAQWKASQQALCARMRLEPLRPLPRFIAGADVAFSRDKERVLAAAVVYDRRTQRIVEIVHAIRPNEVPYIPGYLAFREAPVLLDAIGKLTHPWGAICFDGQGYAHPRRCGLAVYVALSLNVPAVGVGKSRLIGTHAEPRQKAGASAPLLDKGETIGLALRTQPHTRPLYISVGHRIDLPSAKRLVLACCTHYRLPEPTRQADIEVAKLKRSLA